MHCSTGRSVAGAILEALGAREGWVGWEGIPVDSSGSRTIGVLKISQRVINGMSYTKTRK